MPLKAMSLEYSHNTRPGGKEDSVKSSFMNPNLSFQLVMSCK